MSVISSIPTPTVTPSSAAATAFTAFTTPDIIELLISALLFFSSATGLFGGSLGFDLARYQFKSTSTACKNIPFLV
jgi:hypothetical protein